MNLGQETEYVEHKRSTGELREGMESIASILNKHGRGTLYFGVRNDGEVVGQDVSDSTLRKVSQAVGSSISPAIYPTVTALDDGCGHGYVRVDFEGDESPYSCNGRFRIRVADEDVMMSDDELRRQVLHAQARKVPWDQWESRRPVADVDEGELRSFVERGNACGRIPEPFTTVEDALARLGLLRGGALTNAAEVLFCPSRTAALKMGILATHSRTEILDLVQEEGTLFGLVRAAERYILVNTRRRLVIDGAGPREEVPEIPPEGGPRGPLQRLRPQGLDVPRLRAGGHFQRHRRDNEPRVVHRGAEPLRAHLRRGQLLALPQRAPRDDPAQVQGHRGLRDGDPADPGRLRGGRHHVRVRARPRGHEVRVPSARPLRGCRQRPATAGNGRQRLSPNDQRILDHLVSVGLSTTAEVSRALDIPARTVRSAMRRLVDAGMVESLGSDRNRAYRAV